jgi:hypothetical protein
LKDLTEIKEKEEKGGGRGSISFMVSTYCWFLDSFFLFILVIKGTWSSWPWQRTMWDLKKCVNKIH